jgi:hypothetical protein
LTFAEVSAEEGFEDGREGHEDDLGRVDRRALLADQELDVGAEGVVHHARQLVP